MQEGPLTPKRQGTLSQLLDAFLVYEIGENRKYRGRPIDYDLARKIAGRLRRRQENNENRA